MSISEIFEIAVRNFLLAEQQAHEQVKKVQIKHSFILKLLTCVSGQSLFFIKSLLNRIKSGLMAFLWEKGKWALKKFEISPIGSFWILNAQIIFEIKKSP